MKPTVINPNNNNNNSGSSNIDNNNDNSNNMSGSNIPNPNLEQQYQQHTGSPGNQTSPGGGHSRRFPFYPGFDFYDPADDEIFSNSGLRSRLNRMRNPFSTWGPRKRRSSLQGDQGIEDDTNEDFNMFPNMTNPWDTTSWNRTTPRKRAQQPPQHPDDDFEDDDHSAFFRSIPDEFRKYIPADFDFPIMRSHLNRQQHQPQQHTPTPPPPPHRSEANIRFEAPPQLQKQQQQPQQHQPQQHQPQQQQQQFERKPKFCDAAMQTDESLDNQQQEENQNVDPNQNLNSHGLRNTMDMGQKSTTEECDRGQRAHSAPPEKTPGNSFASASSSSNNNNQGGAEHDQQQPPQPPPRAEAFVTTSPNGGVATAFATASAGTNTYPAQNNPGYPRQYYYPFQQQHHHQQSRPAQQHQPTTTHPNQQSQASQPSTPGGTFVRHVPIVLESRKVAPKTNQPKSPIPAPAPPTQQNQPQQTSADREIPIQTQSQGTSAQTPPPPLQDRVITKIRGIQQDVMELMIQIDKFSGNRKSKEYIWLDEMLTRNLIKLDDIETDGKENIRLARREAIKCIQASLAVLEMKADGRTSLRQEQVPMETDPTPELTTEEATSMDIDQKSPAVVQDEKSQTDIIETVADSEISNDNTNLEKTDEEKIKLTTTENVEKEKSKQSTPMEEKQQNNDEKCENVVIDEKKNVEP